MIPLLAQLGIALAAGVAQKIAADKKHKQDSQQHTRDVIEGIYDKRASRAGDAMYMQQAIHGSKSAPKKPKDSEILGPLAANVGMALLNRSEVPGGDMPPVFSERPDSSTATAVDTAFNVDKGSKGWAGGNQWDEEDKYRNIA